MKALSSGSCQCHRDPTPWVMLSLPPPHPPPPTLWECQSPLNSVGNIVIVSLAPWGMMHLVL